MYWKKNDTRVFNKPLYVVKEFGDIKIGIFGLTTTDTPFKASHTDARKLFNFKSPVKEAQKVINILKEKEKVNFVIAVTHMGHEPSETADGDIQLAQGTEGLDVIVGGHSQEIINAVKVKNTIVVQAEDWGKYLGKLELSISKKDWRFDTYNLIPVNLKKKVDGKLQLVGKEIPENQRMVKFFDSYKSKVEKLGNVKIGRISKELEGGRSIVRTRPMAIGQLFGAALSEMAKVDMSISNGGGLRATLKKGTVRRKDLHKVHPFSGTIVTAKFNTEEFFNYVAEISKFLIVDKTKSLKGAFPHFYGMKVKINKKGELLEIIDTSGRWNVIKKDGQIISTKKSFTIAISNFLARGGDNYPDLSGKKGISDTGFALNRSLENFFQKNKKIDIDSLEKRARESMVIVD